jgi:hypothetical protein
MDKAFGSATPWASYPATGLDAVAENSASFRHSGRKLRRKDDVIWRINIPEVKKRLPDELRDVLKHAWADLFSVEMLETAIPTLQDLDAWRPDEPFVLFFEPPSLDVRIINQGAILSVMPRARLVLGGFLQQHPLLYDRIIIPR